LKVKLHRAIPHDADRKTVSIKRRGATGTCVSRS
jgi:hypothetical protein